MRIAEAGLLIFAVAACAGAQEAEPRRQPQWRIAGNEASQAVENAEPARESRSATTGSARGDGALANSSGPSLEGSIGYQISGATVQLRAARVINRSTNTTTGTLRLELWATAQPYSAGGISGYQTATYQFSQVLPPGYSYDNIMQTVSFREPPAGVYYMTLLLTEYNNGQFLIVDHAAFSGTATFGGGGGSGGGGLKIEGEASYERSGDRVTLRAAKVVNQSATRTSGSLKLSLWATASRYTGGSISGYETASIDLAPLSPNYHYSGIARETSFREPPAGVYWMTMLLSEWSGSEWLIVDHVSFSSQTSFGGPGGGGGSGALRLIGTSTYQIRGGEVRITTERIENTMSRASNALRLELWASTSPYSGGSITGYSTAAIRFTNTLGANQYFANIDQTVNFQPPPAGSYSMTLLLLEQQGSEFVIRDAQSFPDRQTFGGNRSAAELISPPDGSSVAGECAVLEWRAGVSAASYYLEAGRTPSSTEYAGMGVGLSASRQICGLPRDGSTVHVRLWTYFGGEDWEVRNSTFRSAGNSLPRVKAEMISPADKSVIDTCADFRWTSGGGVEEYYIQAGSSPSRSEYFDASAGRDTNRRICGFPASGQVFVRLFSRWGGDWDSGSYTYSVEGSAGGPLSAEPRILSGCAASGRRVQLFWNVGSSDETQVRVGSPTGTPMTGWNRGPGSAWSGDWVSPGMQFFLTARSGRVLGAVRIGSDCASLPGIEADPQLITRCTNNLGVTALRWNAPGAGSVRVRVDSRTGADMTGLTSSQGTSVTGTWVRNGMSFFLVDALNRELARTTAAVACQ